MARKGRPLRRPSSDPRKAASLLEGAKRLGITYTKAKRLRQDGWESDRTGKLDLAEGERLLKERMSRAPDFGGDSTAAVTWKERKLKAQALGAEIELAERTKQLVAKSDVRRYWGMQSVRVVNAFKGMGRALAPLLAHKGPQEIQAIIDRRVFEILKELSNADYGPQS